MRHSSCHHRRLQLAAVLVLVLLLLCLLLCLFLLLQRVWWCCWWHRAPGQPWLWHLTAKDSSHHICIHLCVCCILISTSTT